MFNDSVIQENKWTKARGMVCSPLLCRGRDKPEWGILPWTGAKAPTLVDCSDGETHLGYGNSVRSSSSKASESGSSAGRGSTQDALSKLSHIRKALCSAHMILSTSPQSRGVKRTIVVHARRRHECLCPGARSELRPLGALCN